MTAALRYALVGLAVFLVQWLLLSRLDIAGATPDAVLLFVAWMGLRFGKRYGLVAGVALGFLLDATYDTWGMHMLLKSLAGFAAGLIPTNERETLLIQPQQAFTAGLLAAFLHNALLVVTKALALGAANLPLLASEWFGAALYTAVVAVVATLFVNRL